MLHFSKIPRMKFFNLRKAAASVSSFSRDPLFNDVHNKPFHSCFQVLKQNTFKVNESFFKKSQLDRKFAFPFLPNKDFRSNSSPFPSNVPSTIPSRLSTMYRSTPNLWAMSSVSSPLSTLSSYPSHLMMPKHSKKDKKEEEITCTKEIVRLLIKHLWPSETKTRLRVIFSVGLLAASKLLNVQVPIMFKYAVDSLSIPSSELVYIPMAMLLGYGAAKAGSALFNELRNIVFSKVAQQAVRNVSRAAFEHLHKLDLKFHLNRQTGALSRIIGRGSRGVSFILNSLVFNVVPLIFEIILVCGLTFSQFGIKYAAIIAGTLAIYTAFTFGVTSWRTKFRRQMNAAENEASAKTIDSLLNYETVKYFNNEHLETQRYDKVLAQFQTAALQANKSLAYLNFGQHLIFSISLCAVMLLASYGIKTGAMSVGDLVMVNGLLFQLSLPLSFLGTIYRDIKQALIDMDSMIKLMNLQPSIKNKPGAKPLELKGGALEFQKVSFGYLPNKKILKNVSFTIQPGHKVAIVGTSGVGKSTILRLLYRFYNPDEGKILIDGQSIEDVTLESLRSSIGVIPQDVVLFNDSIYFNIAYGNPDATRSEVQEAAKKAHIHETIMQMPKGYDTFVGERGLKLSGGEKQRVAIARALLKNPAILFCDEATSSLDPKTEKSIQASINEVFQGRTTIHIAHRLSSIVDANQIIVIGPEGVLEQGTHQELLQQGKTYFQMWVDQNDTQDFLNPSVGC